MDRGYGIPLLQDEVKEADKVPHPSEGLLSESSLLKELEKLKSKNPTNSCIGTAHMIAKILEKANKWEIKNINI